MSIAASCSIPKEPEKSAFGLGQNPYNRRSQVGSYCINTNQLAKPAVVDSRELSQQPKNRFFRFFGYKSLNDTEKMTKFFEELLLEHGGAYTLLGSKPMTIEDLVNEEDLPKMQKYIKEHPELDVVQVERHFEEGWEAWKKSKHNFISKRFILTELDCFDSKSLLFINIPHTISVMQKNYEDFKRVFGSDFDPVEIMQEEKKELWKPLIQNPATLGILLGYGPKNAHSFEKDRHKESDSSENNDPRLKAECYLNGVPFRIPIFAIHDEEESLSFIHQYKREREQIKSLYEGKDFLYVTLTHLQK